MNKISNIQWKLEVLKQEMYAHSKQQAGCRFVTVDAYQNALGFYQKNGFNFLTEKDEQAETRVMYLDLKAFG